MRQLVTIDLTSADITLFEGYERKVIPLLGKYDGRLELCVRSVDGTTETHVLYFPDVARFEAFLADPERSEMQEEWNNTGATPTVTEVTAVSYPS